MNSIYDIVLVDVQSSFVSLSLYTYLSRAQYGVVERLTGAAFRSPEDSENENEHNDSEEGEELFSGWGRGGAGGGAAMRVQPNGQGSSTWASGAAGGDKVIIIIICGCGKRGGGWE